MPRLVALMNGSAMTVRRAFSLLAVLIAINAVACTAGKVTDEGPSQTSPDTIKRPPTVVQRAAISVNVSIANDDQSIAAQAGVSGVGATVHLLRLASGDAERTAVVGAGGAVTFDSLLEGSYAISVDRTLTANELLRLSPAQREAAVFAGGTQVILRPPAPITGTVALVAARRGSVVISELFAYAPGPPIFYSYGNYVEVFNNADTTAYLDGMLLFMTASPEHTDIWGGCDVNAAFREDSAHVWANVIQAFPGSGRDFPIAPRTAKVIAMDALNHRAASPETDQVDLSNADFEQIGSDADINNPFVPDMIKVRADGGAFGRGFPLSAKRSYGIALAMAASQLVSRQLIPRIAGTGITLYGIPASSVLDVVSTTLTPVERAKLDALGASERECVPFIAQNFDIAVAPLNSPPLRMAMARKSLGFDAPGRERLQRTRNSARDLDYSQPLRRSLLKP